MYVCTCAKTYVSGTFPTILKCFLKLSMQRYTYHQNNVYVVRKEFNSEIIRNV